MNTFTGPTIRLCALEERHIAAMLDAPEDTELERADDAITFPRSREQRRAELEAHMRKERTDDSCFLIIETLDGQLIGNIATFDCDRRVGTFKYSIVLQRAHWGQGYAREAVTLLLRYYFRELRYQKVTILIYSFNDRSIRFHERFGFIPEGRLRRVVYTHGTHYDELYFGLTTEEFDALDPLDSLEG